MYRIGLLNKEVDRRRLTDLVAGSVLMGGLFLCDDFSLIHAMPKITSRTCVILTIFRSTTHSSPRLNPMQPCTNTSGGELSLDYGRLNPISVLLASARALGSSPTKCGHSDMMRQDGGKRHSSYVFSSASMDMVEKLREMREMWRIVGVGVCKQTLYTLIT